MAKRKSRSVQSVTLEMPIFAAVLAHVAHERGVSLPFAVTIQSGHGEPDKHFAIVSEFGQPVAHPCACHAEAAAIVRCATAPKQAA